YNDARISSSDASHRRRNGTAMERSESVALESQSQPPSLELNPQSLAEVPWRRADVIVGATGLVPLLVISLLGSLGFGAWITALPGWFMLLLLTLTELWMVGFPLSVALRRGYRPRLPR